MITKAFVFLWGQRVGAVAWDAATGTGTFEYDQEFLKKNLEIAPVMMRIDSGKKIHAFPELRNTSFKGLPGLLADCLPDKYGNALINAWLTREGRQTDSMNPVEMLCFIGTRGMGALEFQPATLHTSNKATNLELDHLIEIAEKILSGRKKFKANLAKNEEKALLDIFKIGTSAGGARAKAVIAFNPKTKKVKSGQAEAPKGFTHWLIKFDGVTDRQFGSSQGYGRVEMAYYYMASDAGIEMTTCRLLEEHDRAHFMTRRFDRGPAGNKIHVQSFHALRHFDYNDILHYSYEQLFETMRILGLPYPQAEQLYRRMVFNVMGRNCDDHTKNFAFMMDKTGIWKLAPAFDICHAYRPGSDWVSQHNLSVNGRRKNITKEDLLVVAKQMNIKKAHRIISEISGVISNWSTYAKKVNVESRLQKAIEKTLLPNL